MTLFALYCQCAGARLVTTTVRGVLTHAACGMTIACDFEHGHTHAAEVEVGEYNTCAKHEPTAQSLASDADDDDESLADDPFND